jgi:hypothetical protein
VAALGVNRPRAAAESRCSVVADEPFAWDAAPEVPHRPSPGLATMRAIAFAFRACSKHATALATLHLSRARAVEDADAGVPPLARASPSSVTADRR